MASPSASSLAEFASSFHNNRRGLSQAEQAAAAALDADMFTLKCETGFLVAGLQVGEAACTPVRSFCTLVTMTVISAWISRRRSIQRLLIFFSHWLSGLLYQLLNVTQDAMISVCWAGEGLGKFIKALKFLELTFANMQALTNLVICVNLALIVMSHRTLSPVSSLSSPPVIWLSLAISAGAAAASVPFWDMIVLTGTYFVPNNETQRGGRWVSISGFFLELIVGASMFVIVAWLLLFRMREIKESWKMHARIRHYFGLTLIATGVNLALGICGTMYLVSGRERPFLIVMSWTARHVHIALDTIVLYGVLGAPARQMDELGGSSSNDPAVSGIRGTCNPESSHGGLRSISGLSQGNSKPHAPNTRTVQGRPKKALATIRPSQSVFGP